MCQYGFQVTLPPTETVVLCFSPAATQTRHGCFSKKNAPPGVALIPRTFVVFPIPI